MKGAADTGRSALFFNNLTKEMDKTMDHVALGSWGEETASAFLQKKVALLNVTFYSGIFGIVAMDKRTCHSGSPHLICRTHYASGRICRPVKIRRLIRTGFLYIDQVQWSGI